MRALLAKQMSAPLRNRGRNIVFDAVAHFNETEGEHHEERCQRVPR